MTEEARKLRWELRKEYIRSKKQVPCHDCGNTFPACCMDFHHECEDTKDPAIGRDSLLKVAKKWSVKRIDEELSKCLVLCANCHRIRHYMEA